MLVFPTPDKKIAVRQKKVWVVEEVYCQNGHSLISNRAVFNNQKGMALLTTLIFVFVLVSFSVALLAMTGNDSKLSTLHRESTRAFYKVIIKKDTLP